MAAVMSKKSAGLTDDRRRDEGLVVGLIDLSMPCSYLVLATRPDKQDRI